MWMIEFLSRARVASAVLVIVLGSVTGCESENPDQPSEPTPPPDGGGARPSPACAGAASTAQTGPGTMMLDGQSREYLLHVPAVAGTQPLPLVIGLHGFILGPTDHERISQFSELADREGFAVVYPKGQEIIPGLLPLQGWNAGACCGSSADDVTFIDALIDHLGEELCIDLNRVYANGFSNGGMMTYRLACELSERIAAAAPVSGSMTIPMQDCNPSRPVPLMHFHGKGDPIVPFEGGGGPIFPSVRAQVEMFAMHNGCSPTPQVTYQNEVDDFVFDEAIQAQGVETGTWQSTCETYSGCNAGADVVLCVETPGHHVWSGADMLGDGPATPQTIPLTQMIWDFFKAHPLR